MTINDWNNKSNHDAAPNAPSMDIRPLTNQAVQKSRGVWQGSGSCNFGTSCIPGMYPVLGPGRAKIGYRHKLGAED